MGDITKELGLPGVLKLKVSRFEPSIYYGAAKLVSDKMGFSKPPICAAEWMHGWLGCDNDNDAFSIDVLEGDKRFYLVATEKHEHFLRQNGIPNCKAVGLPFAYVDHDPQIERIAGSLLVMPPHITSNLKKTWVEIDYLEYIKSISKYFSRIVFCVSRPCLDEDLWIKNLNKKGYDYVIGSDTTDLNSLVRMRKLFDSFEYMTSNRFGSHILYAALCGVKVSVAGPYYYFIDVNELAKTPNRDDQEFVNELEINLRDREIEVVTRKYPMFFVAPKDATEQVEWAKKEIGYYNKIPYSQLAELLGWSNKDIFIS